MMDQVGIRALQQHASEVVRRVSTGESLEITDRGRPVAWLVPVPSNSRMNQLIDAGLARAPRLSLSDMPPPLPATGPSLTELLDEQRRSER